MKKVLFLFIFFTLIFLPVLCFAEQIDINSATLPQLEELTDIGPTKAQAIINTRPFSSVDDLVKVKGIKSGILADIITQGFACVNCQTQIDESSTSSSSNASLSSSSSSSSSSSALIIIYPSGVVINEILPNPEGPDETDEWIVSTIRQIPSVYS